MRSGRKPRRSVRPKAGRTRTSGSAEERLDEVRDPGREDRLRGCPQRVERPPAVLDDDLALLVRPLVGHQVDVVRPYEEVLLLLLELFAVPHEVGEALEDHLAELPRDDAGLLEQLANRRLRERLVTLQAAAGTEPPRLDARVVRGDALEQQDPAFAVDDDALRRAAQALRQSTMAG